MPGVGKRTQSKQMRIAIAIAALVGLVGLALISFVIALAASGHRAQVVAPTPAAATVVMSELDANVRPGAPVDAAALAGSAAPSAPSTGADTITTPGAYLEIETVPPGGTVRVGAQVRLAPAQIPVEAGTLELIGELPGYSPETRSVTITPGTPGEPGAHVKVELTFHHQLATPGHPGTQTGRLSVRTTPYSEVFESGKKIAETPFAEREMSVGPHVLVFKNPLHPPMTRRVVINAGKLTKFNEKLAD